MNDGPVFLLLPSFETVFMGLVYSEIVLSKPVLSVLKPMKVR
jgi:hypothetical protein